MWDLWWVERCWDRVFSELFGFPLSVSFHQDSVLIHHLGDEQKARWWLQFGDIIPLPSNMNSMKKLREHEEHNFYKRI
jgi:hypothetical protein